MPKLFWPVKDPSESAFYGVDWETTLAGADTISTSAFAKSPAELDLPTGRLVLAAPTHDSTVSSVRISGGVLGVTYELTNTIVTVGGDTFEQSVVLQIKQL